MVRLEHRHPESSKFFCFFFIDGFHRLLLLKVDFELLKVNTPEAEKSNPQLLKSRSER